MAGPTQHLPWVPMWLDEPVGAQPVFPDIDPNALAAQQPVEMVPGLGIPAAPIEEMLAAQPQPMDPYAGMVEDGPVLHPDMTMPTDIPVTSPWMVPDAGPVTSPSFDTPVENPAPDPIDGTPPMFAPDTRQPGLPTEYLTDEQYDQYVENVAVNDPVQFAKLQAQHENAAANNYAAELVRASEENRRKADEHLADLRAAREEAARRTAVIDEQAAVIASRKIDPNRYWRSRSAGQKVANLVGLLAGGLDPTGQGGRRNLFMDDLTATIDQDIDAQKADLENAWTGVTQRRGMVAEEFQRTGDLFTAAETVRQASYMAVREELLARQQMFDPRNTRALKVGQSIAAAEGKIAASRAAAQQQAFENEIKWREQNRKDAETAAKIAADRAKLAASGGPGRAKARPILLPKTAWAKQEGVQTWGPDAERAYTEYAANVSRAQQAWSASGGGRVAGGTATASTPTPTQNAATATSAPAGAALPTAPPEPQAQPKAGYESPDAWFEANTPAATDEEKKLYYFIDGKNGSEAPPLKFEHVDDAKAFREKLRIRRQMAEKASQVITLVDKLRGNASTWDRVRRAGPRWMDINDPDVQELRSVHQSLGLDAIKANGMGVPTGKDVEMTANMVGGDPAGWQDIKPQLQRQRETLQLEADADWSTYVPSAAKDGRYNRYRVLPTASADWVAKVNKRGAVKVVAAEMGNDDPKQLTPVAAKGDAPDAPTAKANEERERNSARISGFLKAGGFAAAAPGAQSRAAEGPLSLEDEATRPLPHIDDYPFKGKPAAGASFEKLRRNFVNTATNADQYLAHGKPADFKAYREGLGLARGAIQKMLEADPALAERYQETLTKQGLSDELVGKIAAELLESGGR